MERREQTMAVVVKHERFWSSFRLQQWAYCGTKYLPRESCLNQLSRAMRNSSRLLLNNTVFDCTKPLHSIATLDSPYHSDENILRHSYQLRVGWQNQQRVSVR